jgi:mono/diheme cytochrome c family protein
MKKTISPLLLAVLLFFVPNPAARAGGAAICGPLGELLYRKHCAACHHDPAKLRPVKNIAEIIRNPPAVMPGFDKDKITDRGVKEIVDYIDQGSDFPILSKKKKTTR